jgi:methylated-DNA-[protein]-cysteine S-methyltransferase
LPSYSKNQHYGAENEATFVSESRLGYGIIPSRFGDLVLVWREEESGTKVVRLYLPSKGLRKEEFVEASYSHKYMDHLSEQIGRYLDGEVIDLPITHLDSNCCSRFQWRVLMADKSIPRGRVCSYSQLAAMIGNPKAARAVGNALAHNPFPIIIPCHRAVRRNGALGGYGGGLQMKRELLEMEGVAFDPRGRVGPEFFWPRSE